MAWNGCGLSNIESVECPVYIIWSLMTESKWLWAVGHSKCGVSYLHNLFLNDRKQVIVSCWTLKVWIKCLLCMYWLSDHVFRSKLGGTLITLSLPLSLSCERNLPFSGQLKSGYQNGRTQTCIVKWLTSNVWWWFDFCDASYEILPCFKADWRTATGKNSNLWHLYESNPCFFNNNTGNVHEYVTAWFSLSTKLCLSIEGE